MSPLHTPDEQFKKAMSHNIWWSKWWNADNLSLRTKQNKVRISIMDWEKQKLIASSSRFFQRRTNPRIKRMGWPRWNEEKSGEQVCPSSGGDDSNGFNQCNQDFPQFKNKLWSGCAPNRVKYPTPYLEEMSGSVFFLWKGKTGEPYGNILMPSRTFSYCGWIHRFRGETFAEGFRIGHGQQSVQNLGGSGSRSITFYRSIAPDADNGVMEEIG